MRILVVSDLHANPAALMAVRERFDVCLCLGDLVDYGPDPGPCLDWVRKNATYGVRGNHDHGVAQDVLIQGASGFRYLTMVTRKSTSNLITDRDRRFLSDFPTTQILTIDGFRIMMVHATPRDPMDEYVPPDPKAWEARLVGLKVDFLLVGHTHIQFKLTAGRTTVVNPGSVGLPRDGNPKARYAMINDGKVELKQVDYDIKSTIASVEASKLDTLAKEMLANVYTMGRYVHPASLPVPTPSPKNMAFYLNGSANGKHVSAKSELVVDTLGYEEN